MSSTMIDSIFIFCNIFGILFICHTITQSAEFNGFCYIQSYVTITTIKFRTYSSLQKEILYPFAVTPCCYPPPALATTDLLSISKDFSMLDILI